MKNYKKLFWVIPLLGLIVFVECKKGTTGPDSSPDIPVVPLGPDSGYIDTVYSFATSTTDPNNDSVAIRFDWGDGNISSWSSWVLSDTSVSMSHSWSNAGTYLVRASAKNKEEVESGWSIGHQIVISDINGTIKWSYDTGPESHQYTISSPAVGSDGTIYVGSEDDNLYAINPDGSFKWYYPTGDKVSTPAIGSDGTIYVASNDYNIYAINPDGTQKWAFSTGEHIGTVGHYSPAIGIDGTIYVTAAGDLFAINSNGTEKWSRENDKYVSTPAIGSDGTIYVCYGDSLSAINPNGSLMWSCAMDDYAGSSPAIGSDGTIYVGTALSRLYAINPDGTFKWYYIKGGGTYSSSSSPAIGSDGTIYVGSTDNNLHAINPDGTQKWICSCGASVYSSPAIGSDGTIYVGSNDYNLYAINPDGTQKWAFLTSGNTPVLSSPAIGPDGTIYVCSGDRLYAFYSSSGGLANTSWPMFHHDERHSGRVGGP